MNVQQSIEFSELLENITPFFFRKVESEKHKGTFLIITACGFILNSKRELMPTITALIDGKKKLFSLPTHFQGWVEYNLALAKTGNNIFPCECELGRLRGRDYIEFVV